MDNTTDHTPSPPALDSLSCNWVHLREQAMACALVLLILAFVVIGAKWDIAPYLINMQQNFGGAYGDSFGVALFLTMLCALFGRHFNTMFQVQTLVHYYALSPSFLTTASLMLTINNSSTPSIHHQHLILVTFLFSMYQRFSGSDEMGSGSEVTTGKRLWSRMVEMLLYMRFPEYKEIWQWKYIVPSTLVVCICRSNEVFRIWRNDSEKTRSDHLRAREGFVHFYEHVMNKIFASVKPCPWPNATTIAKPYGYPITRLDQIKIDLKEFGMYGHRFKPNKQYGFFWVEGSGLLVLSTVIVATLIFVSSLKAKVTSLKWRLIACIVSGGNLVYVLVQCLPGLIVFLGKAHELTTLVENTNTIDTNNTSTGRIIHLGIIHRCLVELQDPWFSDIKKFCSILINNGLPIEDDTVSIMISSWKFDVRKVEGLELITHVAIYGLTRALARIFLISLAYLIKITSWFNLLASILWPKLVPNLAYVAANLTALDVTRVKRAIIEAEIALDTRKPCTCSSSSSSSNIMPCINPIRIDDLLGVLEDESNFGMTVQIAEDLKRQVITTGMLQSTQEALNEVGAEEEIYKASSRLHPIVGLLKRLYIDWGIQYDHELAVNQVADRLKTYFSQKWNSYILNSTAAAAAGGGGSKCVKEEDWKLMRIQLQASMLLFYFSQPSTSLLHIVTRDILYEWLERRRHIEGINQCDCIR